MRESLPDRSPALGAHLKPTREETNLRRGRRRIAGLVAVQRLDQGQCPVVGRQGVAGAAQLDQDVADPLVGGGRIDLQSRIVASLSEELAVVLRAPLPAAPAAARGGRVP